MWNSKTFSWGFVVKLILMAIVNALGVYICFFAFVKESWWIFGFMLVVLLLLDYVYFTNKHTLPMKYILPGVIFLLIFQIFVILYTLGVAFTNYGTGHNLTKDQAVSQILSSRESKVEDSKGYPLTAIQQGDQYGFAVIEGDTVKAGLGAAHNDAGNPINVDAAVISEAPEEVPLAVVEGAEFSGKKITSVPGYEIVPTQFLVKHQQFFAKLRVPVSDDPTAGSIRTTDMMNGFEYKSTFSYDGTNLVDTKNNVTYTDNGKGSFADETGHAIEPGWQVFIGFENFTKAFTDPTYSGPFLRVLLWNIAFALLSVISTFLLGLFLAAVFNEERVKGRKIYRTLLLLPYAFPAFLSALIWSGLLNTDFGFINNVLLGGAEVPWLTDDWLAKLSVLGVNLWLGFPYMFLICTGALQALPADIKEAAKVDGASPLRTWFSVTGPLILVSTAPVLIASFSFNFNNFTLIYMLTEGGPRFTDVSAPVGATDILISMVYQISGISGQGARDFGLGSALSILIFIIVAVVSALGFRQTRKLEEMI
jgi:arabinogalactan oligomer/maltooligosaccharide transport system permease protein